MSSITQPTEVVTEAEFTLADLNATAERINDAIERIKGHEDVFEESTLEYRLVIGLEIARAQSAFGISIGERAKLGGDSKAALSRRDKADEKPTVITCNPLGFSNWIAKEIPDLKRSTAIKYATAFQALGIAPQDATPAKIRAKIKDLRHHAGKSNLPMPSLGMLYKQGKPRKQDTPALIEPEDTKEIRLGDAREWVATWIADWDRGVKDGLLEELPEIEVTALLDTVRGISDHLKLRTSKPKALPR
jgi:hypothetical protein